MTHLPCLAEVEREAELAAEGILELDGRLILLAVSFLGLFPGVLERLLLQGLVLRLPRRRSCLGGRLGGFGGLAFLFELLACRELCRQLGFRLEFLPPFGLLGRFLSCGRLGLVFGFLGGFDLFALGPDGGGQLLLLLFEGRFEGAFRFRLDPLQSFGVLGCPGGGGGFCCVFGLDPGEDSVLLLPDGQLDSCPGLGLGQGRSLCLPPLSLVGCPQLGGKLFTGLPFDPLHRLLVLPLPLFLLLLFVLYTLPCRLIGFDPCEFNLLSRLLLGRLHLLHPYSQLLLGFLLQPFFQLLLLLRVFQCFLLRLVLCKLRLHGFDFWVRLLNRRRSGRGGLWPGGFGRRRGRGIVHVRLQVRRDPIPRRSAAVVAGGALVVGHHVVWITTVFVPEVAGAIPAMGRREGVLVVAVRNHLAAVVVLHVAADVALGVRGRGRLVAARPGAVECALVLRLRWAVTTRIRLVVLFGRIYTHWRRRGGLIEWLAPGSRDPVAPRIPTERPWAVRSRERGGGGVSVACRRRVRRVKLAVLVTPLLLLVFFLLVVVVN